jgi:16S rRNA (adenine1518-N6/adenine1519-N6)-dimethyltransferase
VPLFFTLARSGFQQKRKKLRNAIASGLRVSPATAQAWLESAGISPSRRAQDLGIEDWERLVRVVEERCGTTTLLKKPQPRR